MQVPALPTPPKTAADSVNTSVTAAGSTAIAIPVNSAGRRARRVLVSIDTDAVYLNAGDATVSADNSNGMIVRPSQPVVLGVAGQTHLAARADSATVVVSVTPLEAM